MVEGKMSQYVSQIEFKEKRHQTAQPVQHVEKKTIQQPPKKSGPIPLFKVAKDDDGDGIPNHLDDDDDNDEIPDHLDDDDDGDGISDNFDNDDDGDGMPDHLDEDDDDDGIPDYI